MVNGARNRLPIVSRVFRAGTALRGRRVFHPDGVAFDARFTVARRLGRITDGVHQGEVRLSRAAGLPEPLPDGHGMAFRIDLPDGPQDLLLTSGLWFGPTRHVLVPTVGFGATWFSSLVSFDVDGARTMFGARWPGIAPWPPHSVRYLRGVDVAGLPPIRLYVDREGEQRQQFATIDLLCRLDDPVARNLRFDPAHEAGGIHPVGVVNAVRASAYVGTS
jgi:hypothetical protein